MIQAEFVVSAVSESDFPREGLPEVVFAGRSNVGKSSLINRLTGNRGLARVSSTPGKTQTINFYRLNRSCMFVDLPGFGYSRSGKAASRRWRILIEHYFHDRPTIALALQLLDARIPPTASDMRLAEWLACRELPHIVVATKSDKLSRNQMRMHMRIISDRLGGREVVMSSAVAGTGCKEIWRRILQATHKS